MHVALQRFVWKANVSSSNLLGHQSSQHAEGLPELRVSVVQVGSCKFKTTGCQWEYFGRACEVHVVHVLLARKFCDAALFIHNCSSHASEFQDFVTAAHGIEQVNAHVVLQAHEIRSTSASCNVRCFVDRFCAVAVGLVSLLNMSMQLILCSPGRHRNMKPASRGFAVSL